jgi:hypothetical protein
MIFNFALVAGLDLLLLFLLVALLGQSLRVEHVSLLNERRDGLSFLGGCAVVGLQLVKHARLNRVSEQLDRAFALFVEMLEPDC